LEHFISNHNEIHVLCQTAFNQDLSRWDVSKVTDMEEIFFNASAFNKDISSWNVSKVTMFSQMFYKALKFNQDLSPWRLNSVGNLVGMFEYAEAFNKNLCQWRDKISVSVRADYMFAFTNCPNKYDPKFEGSTIKNMCHDCI
jgi:surface protein